MKNKSICKLKNECVLFTGNSISDSNKDDYTDKENAYPYISTKDIDLSSHKIDYYNDMFVKKNDKNFKIAPKESILLCIEGGSAGKKIAITNQEVAFVNKLCCIKSKNNTKYIYYYLQSNKFVEDFQLNMSGLIGGVSLNKLKDIKIITYPIEDQSKIVAFLDNKCEKIDRIIENNKKEIQLVEEYKESLISNTLRKGIYGNETKLTDVYYLKEISKNWKLAKIGRIFSIKKEIIGKEGVDVLSITQNGIKIKDISSNEGQLAADYSKYQIVEINDFAMNHMDLLTGWIDCSKYYGVTSPDYRVFNFKDESKYDKRYYLYLFQLFYKEKIFYGLAQGVSDFGRMRLQKDQFLNMLIPVPDITEQKEIANYLDLKCSRLNSIIEYRKNIIEKLEEYKKSLIYEIVTGKKEI